MWATIQWGSVGDWVSGTATAIAVVVALIFSLRDEKERRDNRFAAVYAWFEIARSPNSLATGVLWLTNNTDYPVFEWNVEVRWTKVDDSTDIRILTGATDFGLLPPGKHPFTLQDYPEEALPTNDSSVEVDLRFRDALTRPRRRLPTGRLVSG